LPKNCGNHFEAARDRKPQKEGHRRKEENNAVVHTERGDGGMSKGEGKRKPSRQSFKKEKRTLRR